MVRGLGLDLVTISRIERLLGRFGDGFLDKIFTPLERAHCDRHRLAAQHYAARFAAKEAILKALSVPKGLRWHELEVRSAPDGRPEVHLHGQAAVAARDLGVTSILLTLTHERDLAAAMVVAEG